jgi:hypothetical protein
MLDEFIGVFDLARDGFEALADLDDLGRLGGRTGSAALARKACGPGPPASQAIYDGIPASACRSKIEFNAGPGVPRPVSILAASAALSASVKAAGPHVSREGFPAGVSRQGFSGFNDLHSAGLDDRRSRPHQPTRSHRRRIPPGLSR